MPLKPVFFMQPIWNYTIGYSLLRFLKDSHFCTLKFPFKNVVSIDLFRPLYLAREATAGIYNE